MFSAPAFAVLPSIVQPCDPANDVTPGALACSGWFAGNLVNGSPADLENQQDALAMIGLPGWVPPWLDKEDGSTGGISGSTVTFSQPMVGLTWVGMHLGAATGAGGIGEQATAFFAFNFLAPTTSITVNYQGLSNAALYATQPVPEPETYALLLAGLGIVGFMARRRKTA